MHGCCRVVVEANYGDCCAYLRNADSLMQATAVANFESKKNVKHILFKILSVTHLVLFFVAFCFYFILFYLGFSRSFQLQTMDVSSISSIFEQHIPTNRCYSIQSLI